MAPSDNPVLTIDNLKTYFTLDEGTLKAVDGVVAVGRCRPDARHHRRERLRQERDRSVDDPGTLHSARAMFGYTVVREVGA